MDELRQKLVKYLENSRPCFESIKANNPEGIKVKDTSERYYSDAKHFLEKNELVNAFAALEYAEGWLDAGVVLGVVSCKKKNPKDY